MANHSGSVPKIVFGAMTIGSAGNEQSRIHDLGDAAKMLDIFQAHSHNEVDTAGSYGGGTSEEYLGRLDWQKRGIAMGTKYYPTIGRVATGTTLKPEDLRKHLQISLKALNAKQIDLWYLHAPDRKTPLEETLEEVNNLHQQGLFKRFGISNYMAWEVSAICEICRRNGWVQPSVYQGVYNAVHRAVEAELFPCLRHYGISFYAFNPLAGGYLTSRYQREHMQSGDVEKGSRFDPSTMQGKGYRMRYWNDAMFDALEILRPVAKTHGLTEVECALRWLSYHSLLSADHGDAIIIGASRAEQLQENLDCLEKGPLPEDVPLAFDQGWNKNRVNNSKYWH